MNFGFVPFGASVDTTITLGNTGNAPVNVTSVTSFGTSFEVLNHGPFVIPVAGTADVNLRFTHLVPGYEATVVRIVSDDSDEDLLTIAVAADDNPSVLDIGNPAPDWTLVDTEFNSHRLFDYRGRVVVMAFFATW